MNKVVVSAAVLAAGLSAVAAQGTVVGAAEPGTMAQTFTEPYTDFLATAGAKKSGCGSSFAGCHGKFTQLSHEVAGKVTVLDDCTFRIQGWQFDGLGPAVEWWGSKQEGDPAEFPYPANAIKIGELGASGDYQVGSKHGGDSDVVVRLGLGEDGNQIEFSDALNHISLWCEDFAVDFGNVALSCEQVEPEVVVVPRPPQLETLPAEETPLVPKIQIDEEEDEDEEEEEEEVGEKDKDDDDEEEEEEEEDEDEEEEDEVEVEEEKEKEVDAVSGPEVLPIKVAEPVLKPAPVDGTTTKEPAVSKTDVDKAPEVEAEAEVVPRAVVGPGVTAPVAVAASTEPEAEVVPTKVTSKVAAAGPATEATAEAFAESTTEALTTEAEAASEESVTATQAAAAGGVTAAAAAGVEAEAERTTPFTPTLTSVGASTAGVTNPSVVTPDAPTARFSTSFNEDGTTIWVPVSEPSAAISSRRTLSAALAAAVVGALGLVVT